jgi:DHA3 family tetracycline resistance protein-like MFS transporter
MRSRISAYAVYLGMETSDSFFFSMVTTASAVYMIEVAHLGALQLVLVGTALELSALVFEVPTGVVADIISRRLSILIGLTLVGVGFLLWGSIPLFFPILVSQVLWGVGATFQSGAWQAWIADELQSQGVGRAYLRGSQFGYSGALAGIGASVLVASLLGLQAAMLAGGAGYLVLAAVLAVVMPERHYRPEPRGERSHRRAMADTLLAGLRTVRGTPVLLTILAITFIAGAASETFDRLWQLHLIDNFTFPTVPNLPPIAWFGLVMAVSLLASIGAVEVMRRRIDTDSHLSTARALLVINVVLMVSIAVFALAGSFELALGSYLLGRIMRRVAIPLSDAWINQSLTPNVRATVISINAQTDAVGQIAGGPLLGWLAAAAGTRAAMLAVAAFLIPSALLYVRTIRRHGRDVIG